MVVGDPPSRTEILHNNIAKNLLQNQQKKIKILINNSKTFFSFEMKSIFSKFSYTIWKFFYCIKL